MAILPIMTIFPELNLRAGNWRGGRSIHKDAFSYLLYREGRDVFFHSNSIFRVLKWMTQNMRMPGKLASPYATQVNLGEITLRCL